MRQFYTILSLLVLGYAVNASASQGPGMLLFETVTANDNNLNTRIYTILHDPRGFVWLGTDAGLLRYDGYSNIRLQLPNPDHSMILATSGVEALALSNDTSLWIGTSQGLINLNLNNWETKSPALIPEKNIRTLLSQNDTCLWVGTDHGLYKYNPKSEQVLYFSQINSGLSQNVIRALHLDKNENLWVGTGDKLNVLKSGERRFESFDLKGEYKPDINHDLILDIQSPPGEGDSILFIGTETGLCMFNRYTYSVHRYNKTNIDIRNEVIKTIHIKSQAEIYFGTDLGFYKLNIEDEEIENFYHDPFNQYSITSNEVWDIAPDSKGDLWLATSNGISRLKTSVDFFKYYPVYFKESGEPIGTRVSDVSFDSSGRCWVATSNGLVSLSEYSEEYEEYLTSFDNLALSTTNISAISFDQKNRLWFGTVAGLNIWDPSKEKIFIPLMDESSGFRMQANYISCIVPGYDNFFWIGTWGGGLFKAWTSENNIEDIQIRYVADLYGMIAAGRDYLFTFQGNSIYALNINTEKVENISNLKPQIGNMNFSSICISADDILWLGSKNQLLKYNINGDSIELIQLPVNEDFTVVGIIEDDDGILWGCNQNSIFRFDPDSKIFKFFSLSRKLPLNRFTPYPFRKTNDGDILVCGYNGFLRFSPSDFEIVKEGREVLITALYINGKPQSPSAQLSSRHTLPEVITNCPDLKLSFKNRNIELDFSSFPFDHIGQERYAYMLTGYDDSWNLTEARSNSVAYNHLPAGEYVFKIKSTTGDLHSPVTSLRIKVFRPPWAQPLPLALYALLFLMAIGFTLFKFWSIRKEKMQMELIQAEKDKNELINNSKTRFYVNMSHELLNSIGLITYPLKNLLADRDIKGSIRNSLLHIEMNAFFLKAYVDQLLNFRAIELGHKVKRVDGRVELISFSKQIVTLFRNKAISNGVLLKFKSEIKELMIDTDEEKLYSILLNLLHNAIAFTPPGGQISVALRHLSSKEVIIEVKDSGTGISSEFHEKVFERFFQVTNENPTNRGMGVGLTIVKDFVEVLNGRIELKSNPGEGTSVKVTLPSIYEDIQKLDDGVLTKEIVNRDAIDNSSKAYMNKLKASNDLPVILIVDDNNEYYEYIESVFADKYVIYAVTSGEEAMHFLNEHFPDIIVSEIQLPGMDGIALCSQIRKKPKTNRIPFIFLTTNAEVDNQVRAIHAGMDVFLTKPCDFNVLEANFANLIRRVEKTEEFISRRLILNAPKEKYDSKDDKLLKEVVDYIHKNITNSQITAREISYALGISHSNLYRRIKHVTDLSLNEFIRHVRLQNAERLLASGKLSVSEVMFEVGFTNHSYFSKCFKKLYNTTPKNYSKEKSSYTSV